MGLGDGLEGRWEVVLVGSRKGVGERSDCVLDWCLGASRVRWLII